MCDFFTVTQKKKCDCFHLSSEKKTIPQKTLLTTQIDSKIIRNFYFLISNLHENEKFVECFVFGSGYDLILISCLLSIYLTFHHFLIRIINHRAHQINILQSVLNCFLIFLPHISCLTNVKSFKTFRNFSMTICKTLSALASAKSKM